MVENSAMVAGRIRNMLNETGDISVVGEATNNKETMAILKTMAPDVVLVSLDLSRKNGIEFLKEIKQQDLSTKVMVLSNHPETYYRNFCMESGADFFFDKSTEFEKIPDVLSSLLF